MQVQFGACVAYVAAVPEDRIAGWATIECLVSREDIRVDPALDLALLFDDVEKDVAADAARRKCILRIELTIRNQLRKLNCGICRVDKQQAARHGVVLVRQAPDESVPIDQGSSAFGADAEKVRMTVYAMFEIQ